MSDTMFNYQTKFWAFLQQASANIQESVYAVYDYIQITLQQSTILQDLYAEWKKCYNETYRWINPVLVELSNTTLHYGTGVSVGVLASILILFFIVTKFLPNKLKSLGYFLMLFGGSASLYLLTYFGGIFTDQATNTVIEHWQYVAGYIVIVGLISFALVYRYGPVTDARTLSLIQWFLQGVGLGLVYNSTQIREVSIALVLVLLTVYNFPRRLFVNERSKKLWYRFFPPKIKLLTQEEYYQQGLTETKKELDKLREYCRSPECPTWKVISKLKSPQRFADFIEGNSWHVTDEELLDYESGPDPDPSHLRSDDDDIEEDEIDFMLSSP